MATLKPTMESAQRLAHFYNRMAAPGQPVPSEVINLLAQLEGATLGPPELNISELVDSYLNTVQRSALAEFESSMRATLPPGYDDLLTMRATLPAYWQPEQEQPPVPATAKPQGEQPPAKPIAPESLLEALRRALAKGELTEQQVLGELSQAPGREALLAELKELEQYERQWQKKKGKWTPERFAKETIGKGKATHYRRLQRLKQLRLLLGSGETK